MGSVRGETADHGPRAREPSGGARGGASTRRWVHREVEDSVLPSRAMCYTRVPLRDLRGPSPHGIPRPPPSATPWPPRFSIVLAAAGLALLAPALTSGKEAPARARPAAAAADSGPRRAGLGGIAAALGGSADPADPSAAARARKLIDAGFENVAIESDPTGTRLTFENRRYRHTAECLGLMARLGDDSLVAYERRLDLVAAAVTLAGPRPALPVT